MMHEAKTAIEALARKKPEMQGKDPLAFWPAYVADAFSVDGKKDTQRFLGISDEQKQNGEWGDHYNHLDLLNCVDSAGKVLSRNVLNRVKVQVQKESPVPPDLYLYPLEWIQTLFWGFHPWWLRKHSCMHQSYIFKWNRVSELPKPLQEFPSAYKPSVRASHFSVSAKRLEQHWAYPALMYATRSQMNNETLTHCYSLPAFRHMTPAELMGTAQAGHKIAASQELAQFTRLKQTFEVDKERRSVMKEDAHRALGEKARKSGVWSITRHGGEYRRPGHAVLDASTKQGRKTLKKVDRLSVVVGVRRGKVICAQPQSAGVQKRAPRQSAGHAAGATSSRMRPRKQPLAKQASLSFNARAALAAVKKASAVKPRAQRSVAAGGGRRAPRAGGIRSPRLQAVAGASDDDDSDSDFVGGGTNGDSESDSGGDESDEPQSDEDSILDMPLNPKLPNGGGPPAVAALPVGGGRTASGGDGGGDTGEGAGQRRDRRGGGGGGGENRTNGDNKDDGKERGGGRRNPPRRGVAAPANLTGPGTKEPVAGHLETTRTVPSVPMSCCSARDAHGAEENEGAVWLWVLNCMPARLL
jgi:hypothetical protein